MIILYGLGNNDSQYLKTKHNIGRKVIEDYCISRGLIPKKEINYYYTKSKISNQIVYFLYSTGYMNNSGMALQEFISYRKLVWTSQDILVIIQDDSDQIEGNWKFTQAGGSAGHHGINSIYSHLLSTKIPIESVWRIKIGIRPVNNRLKSETFVLSPLSQIDLISVDKITQRLPNTLQYLSMQEFNKAQSFLNSPIS